MTQTESITARSGDVTLAGEAAGDGPLVVLLHGLTATRRYVVMGSRLLERSGHRVVAYDARGHGETSAPADPGAYGYDALCDDLDAVLDAAGGGPAALVGNSMGAHTAAAYALRRPERVAALVAVGPAFDGPRHDAADLDAWDALAAGLERDGIDGFLAAWRPAVPERWRETVVEVARQRLARHRDLGAVAAALRVVPRSLPFGGMGDLEGIAAPALVVGSRDEADPGHPLAVAERWADLIPDARLVVEDEGSSPLAWQGARLSRAVGEFLAEAGHS
ncbi:MAG TPA: alpha/beta hydrolase [Thermoleophilaceae bacterium]|nr:alpha/beta hydrolase [Thermoleophilaceae bacterium]